MFEKNKSKSQEEFKNHLYCDRLIGSIENEHSNSKQHKRKFNNSHANSESSALTKESDKQDDANNVPVQKKKVLLVFLPFWTPLVPPMGIAVLKTFLQEHSYAVSTVDGCIDFDFNRSYKQYLTFLREVVPQDKQGNFHNIGHDVLRNHLVAHFCSNDKKEYYDLITEIIYQTFFIKLDKRKIIEIDYIINDLYQNLKSFIHKQIIDKRPQVLGLSIVRDNIGPAMFVGKIAKEIDPEIKTIVGGSIFSDHLRMGSPNFEAFIKRAEYIDHIIIGEGPMLMLKVLENEDFHERKILTQEDLEENEKYLPPMLPDYSDFTLENYTYLSAFGSQSCSNNCSFCTVRGFWGDYKEKDPKLTILEMEQLRQMHNKQLFFMNDSLLNHIASGLSKERINSKLDLFWDGYLRVDPKCDIDTAILWRKGGFYRARLGIESGSQKILDLMNKNILVEDSKNTLKNLALAGIKTTAYMLIGHPGESEEDFKMTLDFMTEMKDYIWEAECNPFIFSYDGQASSKSWKNKRQSLYGEKYDDIFWFQSWTIDSSPSREEVYERVNIFVDHCLKLGIPNPYTIREIIHADERWKRLHKNSVPYLIDFQTSKGDYKESKEIKRIKPLEKIAFDSKDFTF